MTFKKWILVVVIAVLVSSCAEAFGDRTGRHESLVAELDAAEQVLIAELDSVFGDYTLLAEGVEVTPCEPLEMYDAGYMARITVAGVDQHTAYDMFIDGRRGLNKVIIEGDPDRSAGFDVDGITGQVSVFDYANVDGLRVAASTGCCEEDSRGVDDPRTLQWGGW